MTDSTAPLPSIAPPIRRSPLALLVGIIRNPLEALPRAVFDAPLVHSRVLGRDRFHVVEPSLIQDAFLDNADALDKGPELKRTLGPALGRGMLTADGAHWRWQRQSAAPIFRHERLLAFLPAMLRAAEETRDRWLAKCDDAKHGDGAKVDLGHEMMHTTFDIIVETMLSGRANIDVAKTEKAITDYLAPTGWVFALSLLNLPDWMPYPGRARMMAASRYLRGQVTRIAAARRAEPRGARDLIDLLLSASDPETGRTMSDSELTDNLLTFITAGHETTALGLAWTIDLLTRHPEIEGRLLAEIEQVTGGEPLKPEHIGQLSYTRQVFQEGMRLYPPVPIIARVAARPFTLANRAVPVGSMVYVPIYALHRHTTLWDRPEQFDPERFAPEQVKARHRYAYMPFGAGPRVCIGSGFAMLEGVAILATLLRAVHVARIAPNAPKPIMRLTLRPQKKLWMRLIRRA